MIYRVRFNGWVYWETRDLHEAMGVCKHLANHYQVDISRVKIIPFRD